MSGTRMFFIAFYALIALVGLFTAGAARDFGMSLFGTGLFLFGVILAYGTVKQHFDEADAARH